MPTDISPALEFSARLLLGGAFAYAGYRNIMAAPILVGMMTARGVPQPRPVLYAGIALQIAAGLLLVAGIWPAWSAAALILFTVVATIMFHNFWDYQGPDRAAHINATIASAAMIGGFLAVIAGAR